MGEGQGAAVRAASEFLKALAHEKRLLILCHLVGGEQTVGEIEAALGLDQAVVSVQLMRLRAQGLVAARRSGRHVHYRLQRPEVIAIVGALQDAFCAPGERLSPVPPGRPEAGPSRRGN